LKFIGETGISFLKLGSFNPTGLMTGRYAHDGRGNRIHNKAVRAERRARNPHLSFSEGVSPVVPLVPQP
jgi:hypothetical protein